MVKCFVSLGKSRRDTRLLWCWWCLECSGHYEAQCHRHRLHLPKCVHTHKHVDTCVCILTRTPKNHRVVLPVYCWGMSGWRGWRRENALRLHSGIAARSHSLRPLPWGTRVGAKTNADNQGLWVTLLRLESRICYFLPSCPFKSCASVSLLRSRWEACFSFYPCWCVLRAGWGLTSGLWRCWVGTLSHKDHT